MDSESESGLDSSSINGSESDSEVTDFCEILTSEFEFRDDGPIQLPGRIWTKIAYEYFYYEKVNSLITNGAILNDPIYDFIFSSLKCPTD